MMAMVLLGACTPRWTIAIDNDTEKPVVFRVSSGGHTWSWLVPVDTALIVFDRVVGMPGDVELIDPATCAILDELAVPNETSLLLASRDESSSTGYALLVIGGERIVDRPIAGPNFTGCGS
jgi:hypothetical protein